MSLWSKPNPGRLREASFLLGLFKKLALSNIAFTFVLILLGSAVHIWEQSSSCFGWPLCLGGGASSFGPFPWVAWAHRLLASLVGGVTIVFSLTLYFKRKYLEERILKWSWWACVLVVFQGFLGAFGSKYAAPALISTIHLLFSMVFLCSLWGIYLGLSLQGEGPKAQTQDRMESPFNWGKILLGALFLQALWGGMARHSEDFLWHLVHRVWALVPLVVTALGFWWTRKSSRRPLTQRVTARTSSKNCNKGNVTAIHLGEIGRRQRRTTEAYFKYAAGSDEADDCQDRQIGEQLPQRENLGEAWALLLLTLLGQMGLGLWSVFRESAPIPRLLHLFFALLAVSLAFALSFKMKGAGGPKSLSLMRDLIELSKPRLTMLVILSAFVGMLLAPGNIHFGRGLMALAAIWVLVAGACALNCCMEKDVDEKMERTRTRALPSGRLSISTVLFVFIPLILFALALLWFGVNPLSALLGLSAVVIYLVAYTPLKKKSNWALFIGAVPGALPPVLGYAAVGGALDMLPLILFALIFVWQIPHFMAISLYLEDDYRRAALKTIPLVWGHRAARFQILFYSAFLLPLSLVPSFWGLATRGYFYVALLLGAFLCLCALRGVFPFKALPDERRWAKGYFWATLCYLPTLLIALLAFSPFI
ncbi:MAG: heme o synthase [Bacteriovoracales bacterium]|nr:heme o synthase [Bacteriovoracales bacterium]